MQPLDKDSERYFGMQRSTQRSRDNSAVNRDVTPELSEAGPLFLKNHNYWPTSRLWAGIHYVLERRAVRRPNLFYVRHNSGEGAVFKVSTGCSGKT